jgi:hypothetical protein
MNVVCKMTPKHSRPQPPQDIPQKKAKLLHKAQIEDDDADFVPSPASRPVITKCPRLSVGWNPKGNAATPFSISSNKSSSEGELETPDKESLSSLAQPPTTHSYPRLGYRRGKTQDNAAGPSYALHDPVTKEIVGDARAKMQYLTTDNEITNLFNDLWNSIDTLSKDHFSNVIPNDQKQKWLQSFPKSLTRNRKQDLEFVSQVNQITVGGPCGIGSWEQILLEPELRRGLVCGIIWKKVQEEVLGKMLFGGTKQQEKELMKLETSMAEDAEGFVS